MKRQRILQENTSPFRADRLQKKFCKSTFLWRMNQLEKVDAGEISWTVQKCAK